MNESHILRTDFLIVGSGIAGLRAAADLMGAGDVVIVTKAHPLEGNTGYAQGGIAAAVGPDDSVELHIADTLAAGDGLCNENAVRVLVEDGRRYVLELIEWGAAFDRTPEGAPALAREGAHSVRRVLHARDQTGREIGSTLWRRISGAPALRVLDHTLAVSAIVEDDRCAGVRCRGERFTVTVQAAATLLATGGAGQVYRETTNPPVATGDGVAIAHNAGADVVDLEFVQFHPTAFALEGHPRFLLSEALRGEGAVLLNAAGERFLERYEPQGELAARDKVARAMMREAQRTRQTVYLTMQHLDPDYVHARFPLIAESCRRAGLDLARDRVPVSPAAHYVMGGVATDLDGRTSVPGLFAAGEVACTGVHGANRLASNSLLEGLVFGARAARAMRDWVAHNRPGRHVLPTPGRPALATRLEHLPTTEEIQQLMWLAVGVFREREPLENAVRQLDDAWRRLDPPGVDASIWSVADYERANILTVARLMARAALRRQESRGGHFRADFPARDDLHWKRHIFETRDEESR